MRVFPLSNWTELDVREYIRKEQIPVVPLYFAKEREMLIRGDLLLPLGHPIDFLSGETPQRAMCRMRSLACTYCTGTIRSSAAAPENSQPKIEKGRFEACLAAPVLAVTGAYSHRRREHAGTPNILRASQHVAATACTLTADPGTARGAAPGYWWSGPPRGRYRAGQRRLQWSSTANSATESACPERHAPRSS